MRKCTYPDCKGFLSSLWRCGICVNWSCSQCFDVIGTTKEGHVCNPDTLASAVLIKSGTKTCPKCSTGIFKIDGCDHMYCVECHTAFSWKTGKISTGAIHNPHYYEWQIRSGNVIERELNEVRCGRELDHNFTTILRQELLYRVCPKNRKETLENIRNIIHLQHIDLPRYTFNNVTDNIDLRALYMLNRMTEDEFKKQIQIRDKNNEKKLQYFNVLRMFIDCATEIFYRMYDIPHTNNDYSVEEKVMNFIDELNNLRLYTNECLLEISRTYHTPPYHLVECLLYKKINEQTRIRIITKNK